MRIMKKNTAFSVFILLFVLALSVDVSANNIHFQGYDTISVSESGLALTEHKPHIVPVNEEDGSGKKAALPVKYDSRQLGVVTPVKDQGIWGTCWAFSAISCAETSLINKYPESFSASETDLSEVQHAYFSYSSAKDKLGLTGDRNIVKDKNWLDIGGNIYVSSTTFAKDFGVATEKSIFPYADVSLSTKISSKKAYSKNIATLKNAYWIDGNDINGIKKLVMKYGSVSAGCYFDWSYINDDYNSLYNGDYYFTNHQITIVGWNDNFSRKKFGTYRQGPPKKNGAWLVKNSHGEDSCENGYFWISYYDNALANDTVAAYDFSLVQSDENKYQYDGLATFGCYFDTSGKVYGANVFKANGDEALKEIAFFNDNNDATYKYQIFLKPKSNNPSSGTPVYSSYKTAKIKYCGYNTIKLENEVQLRKGMRFAVVIKVINKEDRAEISVDYNDSIFFDGDNTSVSLGILKGESFTSSDGKYWYDLIHESDCGNLKIKAVTRNGLAKPKKITAEDVTVEKGSTAKVIAVITPNYASKQLLYSSSDNNVATVSSKGVITGKEIGTCEITITSKASDKVKKTITVNVLPAAPTAFAAGNSSTSAVNVSWEAAEGSEGYKLFIDKEGEPEFVGTTDETSFKFRELETGGRYTVYVCSFITVDEEEVDSPLVSLKIGTRTEAPEISSLKSQKSKTAVVKWDKVTGAKSYIVYTSNDKETWTKAVSTKKATATLTNLTGGNKIYVRVAAVNAFKKYSAKSAVRSVKIKK